MTSIAARFVPAAAAAALLLAGCAAVADQIGAVAPQASANPQHVEKRQFGTGWPLRVDSGTVACTANGEQTVITFTSPDGVVYALNDGAQAVRYPSVDELADPSAADTMWTLRSLGVAVCLVSK